MTAMMEDRWLPGTMIPEYRPAEPAAVDEPEPADLDPRGDREDAEQYGYAYGDDKR